jgi:hypothetical protein
MSNVTVSTRAASTLALMHVLDNFIPHPKISCAFKKSGVEEISNLLQLNDLDINNLKYDITENSVTTTHSLHKGGMGIMRFFRNFVHHRSSIYDPSGNDWLSVTYRMLDEFRTNPTQINNFNSVDSIHTTLPPDTPSPLSELPHHLLYLLNTLSTCSSAV